MGLLNQPAQFLISQLMSVIRLFRYLLMLLFHSVRWGCEMEKLKNEMVNFIYLYTGIVIGIFILHYSDNSAAREIGLYLLGIISVKIKSGQQ